MARKLYPEDQAIPFAVIFTVSLWNSVWYPLIFSQLILQLPAHSMIPNITLVNSCCSPLNIADDGFYCLQPWIQAEFVLEIIRGSELMLIGNFLNLTSNIQPNPKLVWVTVSKSRCYLHGIIRFAEHLKILINLILMPKPETVLLAENMTTFHVHFRNTTK